MKLSIRWIFDHIQAQWTDVDISRLVTLFNGKTAEIEHVEHIAVDLQSLSVVSIIGHDAHGISIKSFEWGMTAVISVRSDIVSAAYYLIKKENGLYRWATLADLGSGKEGLVPALFFREEEIGGSWKNKVEVEDYIIHVDNKSITHRPDLWGHRGFAREIAALLNVPFKTEKECIVEKPFIQTSPSDGIAHRVVVLPPETEKCKRFAGLYFESIEHRASSLWMAHRLLRIDARPIDLIVDATNYVMFDMSQPVHAFDADTLATKKIVPRMAYAGEVLELLDGQKVVLATEDIVITDGQKPIALAGIMGGKETGVSSKTRALLLEAACFDAATIRRTSVRLKIRSEASARFEKSLDPNQNITAIKRFIKLLDDECVAYKDAPEIVSFGNVFNPITIDISHTFIEEKIGARLEKTFIIDTLQKIQFDTFEYSGVYTITVPTFRATKDIGIKEDIVEEIVRFYGYSVVTPQLPEKATKAHSLERLYRMRSIKKICAYGMMARELCNYAFFDESFLSELQWQPEHAVGVRNPVSENYRRLATTLMPGLLKGLVTNHMSEEMRFFEWGRTWKMGGSIQEKQALAGIFFSKKLIDFYEAKALVVRLFSFLNMHVEWRKVDDPEHPWFMPYQTAQLLLDGVVIGIAGKLNQHALSEVLQGDAFAFELDGDALLAYSMPTMQYQTPSRYPSISRDISVLAPLQLTVHTCTQAIQAVDNALYDIKLVDMFEKEEWLGKRSLTFRFSIRAFDRTLTKEQADDVVAHIADILKELGVEIR